MNRKEIRLRLLRPTETVEGHGYLTVTFLVGKEKGTLEQGPAQVEVLDEDGNWYNLDVVAEEIKRILVQ